MRRARLFFALALDRQATRPEFDVHAFGLMAVAIELVAQYGHGDGKCANDQIKHVRASHGRIPLDTIAFALTASAYQPRRFVSRVPNRIWRASAPAKRGEGDHAERGGGGFVRLFEGIVE